MLIEICGTCEKYGNGCNGMKLTYPELPAGTHVGVEITCKLHTPKKKVVDPSATCGDCKSLSYENPEWSWCAKRGGNKRRPGDSACILHFEPNEQTDTPSKTVFATDLLIGAEAICRHCGELIIWSGDVWDHKNGTPRHPGQPREML